MIERVNLWAADVVSPDLTTYRGGLIAEKHFWSDAVLSATLSGMMRSQVTGYDNEFIASTAAEGEAYNTIAQYFNVFNNQSNTTEIKGLTPFAAPAGLPGVYAGLGRYTDEFFGAANVRGDVLTRISRDMMALHIVRRFTHGDDLETTAMMTFILKKHRHETKILFLSSASQAQPFPNNEFKEAKVGPP